MEFQDGRFFKMCVRHVNYDNTSVTRHVHPDAQFLPIVAAILATVGDCDEAKEWDLRQSYARLLQGLREDA
jgi:hypothetical protein